VAPSRRRRASASDRRAKIDDLCERECRVAASCKHLLDERSTSLVSPHSVRLTSWWSVMSRPRNSSAKDELTCAIPVKSTWLRAPGVGKQPLPELGSPAASRKGAAESAEFEGVGCDSPSSRHAR
jgi:hypothetical protein